MVTYMPRQYLLKEVRFLTTGNFLSGSLRQVCDRVVVWFQGLAFDLVLCWNCRRVITVCI